MKKIIVFILAALMTLALSACNTEQDAAERKDTNNLENVSFGPEDQGIQPNQIPGELAPGQNRVDANIPYEGLNPNGASGSVRGLNIYEEADRYNNENQNHLGSSKERVDQVDGAFKNEVVHLTNNAREKKGLKPLKISTQVTEVAQKKAEDMSENNYFAHTSPTYGTPFEMLKEFGVDYRIAAENIAAGQQTPEQVVNGWLNSPDHRKNIMNKNLTHIGVGFDSDGQYWTQIFIKQK